MTDISSVFSAGPANGDGRENVVRERLYNLLTTLGELPLDVERPRVWEGNFAAVLQACCPAGYSVLCGAHLPGHPLAIDHLVVGPAGLVVVGRTDDPGTLGLGASRPAGVYRGASWRQKSASGLGGGRHGGPPTRPGPVRETLRRAFALRAWLKGTPCAGVAVLAAVCSPPVPDHRRRPALLLDGLWVGTIDQLQGWLLAAPEGADGGELTAFLARELDAG